MTYDEALEEAIACLKQFVEEEAELPDDRWDRDLLVDRANDALYSLKYPDPEDD